MSYVVCIKALTTSGKQNRIYLAIDDLVNANKAFIEAQEVGSVISVTLGEVLKHKIVREDLEDS